MGVGGRRARGAAPGGRLLRRVPLAPWLRHYEPRWLREDAVAGAGLFALLIPAGMAYAQAAGLPPVTGLYATVVPMAVYALVGPSRVLVLGPDSALAPLIAASVLPLAAGSAERAVALAGLLALLMGALMVAGSLLRLGVVTHLLSRPIRLGYLGGLALVVFASQLATLLGLHASGATPWEELVALASALPEANPVSVAVGAGSLAVIAAARLLGWRLVGMLAAVAGSGVATWALGLGARTAVAGALPSGPPPPPLVGVALGDAVALVVPAAGIALMTFADSGVLSKSLAARYGGDVSGNRELGAIGLANAVTGVLGGFPVSASGSRTPVALAAGARSQLSGVVAAALVLAFMLLAPGATAYIPTATLAAVVIAAVAGLVEVPEIIRLARMSRGEAAVMAATFLGVTTLGVLTGILVAIGLALLEFVRRAFTPYRAELGHLQDVPGYHDLSRHPEGTRIPGLILARFDAPLFFANGSVLTDFVRALVEAAGRPVTHVVLAAEPITGIDTTALEELIELDEWLARRGIELVFAELKGPMKDRLVRFGTRARFGVDHFYPTVGAAVRTLRADRAGPGKHDGGEEPPALGPPAS
ncbi:high affinity sulfate transporter 1 [Sinomonas atrocyanea]|uniref:SulP family inorganic anion transporter n=1 Tax=Sinomonas atrocyanea TaxID=37927 RepID=UPI0027887EDE|nr:SulP family inorganic anion transporter [Sinomonas atrocyanea]MDP9883864.1 high affinity sulfate transporter 1 [Sinomonas atrocyanea]